jgi:hypothetical protein
MSNAEVHMDNQLAKWFEEKTGTNLPKGACLCILEDGIGVDLNRMRSMERWVFSTTVLSKKGFKNIPKGTIRKNCTGNYIRRP